MEQLIQSFGIDTKLIIVQIINFAILLAALSYFLYKPVLRVINDRQAKIEQGVRDAEAAAAAKAEADTEKRDILAAAQGDAQAVTARAKEAANVQSEEIVSAANEKAAQIVAAAEARGEERAAQLQKDSEAEVAKLAVLAAETVLREKA